MKIIDIYLIKEIYNIIKFYKWKNKYPYKGFITYSIVFNKYYNK